MAGCHHRMAAKYRLARASGPFSGRQVATCAASLFLAGRSASQLSVSFDCSGARLPPPVAALLTAAGRSGRSFRTMLPLVRSVRRSRNDARAGAPLLKGRARPRWLPARHRSLPVGCNARRPGCIWDYPGRPTLAGICAGITLACQPGGWLVAPSHSTARDCTWNRTDRPLARLVRSWSCSCFFSV